MGRENSFKFKTIKTLFVGVVKSLNEKLYAKRRMVNRVWGEEGMQLKERHSEEDFKTLNLKS